MAPDPAFDARMRQALSGEAGAAPFDDASGAARTAVVAGVRRRHRRRLEALGGVSAALVAVAIVAVVGLGSGGGPHTVAGERAATTSVPSTIPKTSESPSAHTPAFGAAGAPPQAPEAAPSPAAPNAACPVARVGATVTVCAGSFATSAGSTPAYAVTPAPTSNQALDSNGFGAAAPAGASTVSLRVGQRLTVTVSSSPVLDHWTRPAVSSGSTVLEAVGPAKASRTGGWTAIFRAVRPGTAIVTSHATCTPQALAATALAPVCSSSTARWSLTVEVTR